MIKTSNSPYSENKPEKETILDIAKNLVYKQHSQDYGGIGQSFPLIAQIVSLLTHKNFTPQDICLVMIILKLVRESYKSQRDNRIDACGYLSILDDLNRELNGNL